MIYKVEIYYSTIRNCKGQCYQDLGGLLKTTITRQVQYCAKVMQTKFDEIRSLFTVNFRGSS